MGAILRASAGASLRSAWGIWTPRIIVELKEVLEGSLLGSQSSPVRFAVGEQNAKLGSIGESLVIGKLKVALPHLDFTGHGKRKKGYDVEVLLPDESAVEKFLEAWRDVVVELDRRSQ